MAGGDALTSPSPTIHTTSFWITVAARRSPSGSALTRRTSRTVPSGDRCTRTPPASAQVPPPRDHTRPASALAPGATGAAAPPAMRQRPALVGSQTVPGATSTAGYALAGGSPWRSVRFSYRPLAKRPTAPPSYPTQTSPSPTRVSHIARREGTASASGTG